MNSHVMWIPLCLAVANPAWGDDARQRWIADHSFPFDTVEAGNGFDDLQPLKDLIGDARIVSLGESTHGSREIFQMKHRMLEFLVEEMGFSIFSIEASMPESYAVGDYVRTGEGDAWELIEGMYFWTWHTEEVLAMVNWMRAHNESGADAVRFTGFDMQTPDVSKGIVLDFIESADPNYLDEAKRMYDGIEDVVGGGSFGVATATFPVEDAIGKHVRFSADIKSELTSGRAAVWWRVDGAERRRLAFDNMGDGGAKGTSDWDRYAIELDVPEGATNINFGVLMPGEGRAWFDNMTIELDGELYENPGRFDLDFNMTPAHGFYTSRGTYLGEIVTDEFTKGTGCLRITSQEVSLLASDAAMQAAQVVSRLQRMKPVLERKKVATAEIDWAIQNATVILQGMNSNAGQSSRDKSMAENVTWIAQQNPDAKIVLWAHNGHVQKHPRWMGGYLEEAFGDNHVVIGFATSRGRYYAKSRGNAEQHVHELQEPPIDSFEAALDRFGKPRVIVDLRDVDPDAPGAAWLGEPVSFRSIGAIAKDIQFNRVPVAELYDAIVFIQETEEARQLAWKTR